MIARAAISSNIHQQIQHLRQLAADGDEESKRWLQILSTAKDHLRLAGDEVPNEPDIDRSDAFRLRNQAYEQLRRHHFKNGSDRAAAKKIHGFVERFAQTEWERCKNSLATPAEFEGKPEALAHEILATSLPLLGVEAIRKIISGRFW